MEKVICPFTLTVGGVKCPYLEEESICGDITVGPGNSDAWCCSMAKAGKELLETAHDLRIGVEAELKALANVSSQVSVEDKAMLRGQRHVFQRVNDKLVELIKRYE